MYYKSETWDWLILIWKANCCGNSSLIENTRLVKYFGKKYLKRGNLSYLQIIDIPKGSITCILYRRGLELFHHQLYRIPRNGRKTLLWDNKIKGNTPLNIDIHYRDQALACQQRIFNIVWYFILGQKQKLGSLDIPRSGRTTYC